MKILVLNSGSSTLKYQLFNVNGDNYEIICKGNAERIARDASFVGIKYADGTTRTTDYAFYELEDRRCGVAVNGQPVFICSRSAVQALVEAT